MKNLHTIGIILLVAVLVSGCQATSSRAGKGTLHLSRSTADSVEKYFEVTVNKTLAVSHSGETWFYSSCPSSRCLYPDAVNAEDYVIKKCERNRYKCGVFALQNQIVWEGPVVLPTTAKDIYTARLIDPHGNKRTHSTGTA